MQRRVTTIGVQSSLHTTVWLGETLSEGQSGMTESRAVLITGCSTGIGRATALHLHKAGWPVYATARRLETLDELAKAGMKTLQLDVTDEDSMNLAVKRVIDDHGAVGVLVNNAGSAVYGSVEDVPLETARASFEANLWGALRLSQLVLPGMRAQKNGRIINVSSILGKFSPPGGAIYNASKHALEAYSDSMRLELAPFGVKVALIEPGTVKTEFYTNSMMLFAGPPDTVYADFYTKLAESAIEIHEGKGRAGSRMISPEQVAAVIEKAMTAPKPKARYVVGSLGRAVLTSRKYMSDAIFDRFVVLGSFPHP